MQLLTDSEFDPAAETAPLRPLPTINTALLSDSDSDEDPAWTADEASDGCDDQDSAIVGMQTRSATGACEPLRPGSNSDSGSDAERRPARFG